MDPDANLKEQADLLDAPDAHGRRRMAGLRRALYEWLNRGGFPPRWSQHPEAATAYRKWERSTWRMEH